MKELTPFLTAALGFLLLLAAIFLPSKNAPREIYEPEREETGTSEKIRYLGWIPYWDQENAFRSFREQSELFDYVGLFWYHLDPEGKIRKYNHALEDPQILKFAKEEGVKVVALVANLPDEPEGGDWDFRRVEKVISSHESRATHIDDLLEIVQSRDFDGLAIDYEALKARQRENFTLFIQELGKTLKERGKILGVAIHPKTSENDPRERNGSEAQDWRKIHPFVDQMYFMTYSEHYLGGLPGPNASPDWVDNILDYAVNEVNVPREKIFMGIPFYGHEWIQTIFGMYQGSDDDVTFRKVEKMIEKYRIAPVWDASSQTPSLLYREGRKAHIVWFENEESLKAKLKVRRKYQIPNLHFWRLGGEDPRVWESLWTLKE